MMTARRPTTALLLLLPALVATTAQAAQVMSLGRCSGVDDIPATQKAGFTFTEMSVRRYALLDEAEWKTLFARVRATRMRIPVSNSFIPGEIKLVGPEIDLDKQSRYLETGLSRARQLGVKVVVFGSGDARRVPDGYPRDKAILELIDFGRRAAAVAKKNGITIAVEPLNRKETNIINTAAEGLALVEAIDRPNFQLMIDFYHMSLENEDPAIVLRAGKRLKHVHMSTRERTVPVGPEGADYETFFANLHRIGYRGGISLETKTEPAWDSVGPKALAFLTEMVRTTGDKVRAEKRK